MTTPTNPAIMLRPFEQLACAWQDERDAILAKGGDVTTYSNVMESCAAELRATCRKVEAELNEPTLPKPVDKMSLCSTCCKRSSRNPCTSASNDITYCGGWKA